MACSALYLVPYHKLLTTKISWSYFTECRSPRHKSFLTFEFCRRWAGQSHPFLLVFHISLLWVQSSKLNLFWYSTESEVSLGNCRRRRMFRDWALLRCWKFSFSYRHADSPVTRDCGEVLSCHRVNLDGPAHCTEYYVDVGIEGNRDLADLKAADDLLEHTVVKTKLTERQEVCLHANVSVLFSILDVVDFAPTRVGASATGNVF